MKIRQILPISAAISIVSVALLSAMMIFLHRMDGHHAQASLKLNAAISKILLIRGFLPDLSGSSRRRAALQWQTQHRELAPILGAILTFDAETIVLKAWVLEQNVALGLLFDNLSKTEHGAVSKESLEIIGGQLDVRTASMVSDVLAINNMTTEYINRQKKLARGAMGMFIAILAGVVVCLLRILQRRIVTPIVTLQEASARFSAGTLDQAIAIEGNDEITALATSFETMRIALRDRLIELDAARTLIKEENDKLAQRVDERTAALKAANCELDSFAYAVSHDLRAPLRAMSGFSQALIEDYGAQLPDDARVYLDQINIASLRMGQLIDGLLVLSRSTRVELRHDGIDLSSMADGILTELTHADPQRKIACQIEPGLSVRGDARMIEVVMTNLLDNAWKYTRSTAQPTIRVYAEAGSHFICVADNGAGFDMAHAGKLFQPFQRLHRQDEFPGTGIGLATVSRIVQRHGGIMKAEGAVGQGATFCFSLSSAAATDKDAAIN